jgi:imidazoleglycerol-phosphate dehydratase
VKRRTNETDIAVSLLMDGTGKADIATGVGFFDHMLDLFARHSLIDLTVKVKGDTHIDDHHSVEDAGIALGEALKQACSAQEGHPSLCRRPSADGRDPDPRRRRRLRPAVPGVPHRFEAQKIGSFDTELVREFFQAFAINAGLTLHVETLYGDNAHHIAESCFKGWRGRCGRRCRSIRARATASPRPRARFVEVLDGILHGHDAAARKATARGNRTARLLPERFARRRSCSRASGCSASGSGSRRCCSCSFWAC